MKVAQKSATKLLVFLVLSGFGFFALGASVFAAGEDYPVKPVNVISGYAPGGSAGNSAMIFTETLKKYLPKPQPFFVIHKAGATGMLAGDYFMKQPADGYTLWWATQDHGMRMAIEPEKFPFTLEDFIYIGTFAYTPYTLTVNAQSSIKTFEEFIDYAKNHPWEMTYSSVGMLSGNHLNLELLMRATGIKVTHVPFPSGTAAVLALLGGHVTCNGGSIGLFGSHVKPGGKARILVVFDTKRSPDFPDVPTAREKGYDIISYHYVVLIAKNGTPKPVLNTLLRVFKQAADDPDAKSALLNAQLIPLYLNPAETGKMVRLDFDRSREVFGKSVQGGK
jgi:tripartite-type tricarboxylate transporter receptor subunit TctC